MLGLARLVPRAALILCVVISVNLTLFPSTAIRLPKIPFPEPPGKPDSVNDVVVPEMNKILARDWHPPDYAAG